MTKEGGKMKYISIKTIMVSLRILLLVNETQAQERKHNFGIDYTTEVHSDFGKKVNWVNLLSLKGQYRIWENGELSLNTISIWKTNKERIIDDLQTFSNIEEDNMAVNIFVAGYAHHFKKIALFAGIRNVNEDFFIGDYTSLFTNSSCGIYPTLSINFPIANYPLSSMCVHGEFELSETLTVKNSLYNGITRQLFSKEGSLFTINPKKDGILNVAELSYSSKSNNYGFYTIGSVQSVYGSNEQEEMSKAKINYALWGSIEKGIYNFQNKSIGVLLQGSFSPADRNDCKYYYGAGIILNSIIPTQSDNILGVFCNNAVFREETEITIEITWKYKVNNHFTFQPSIHCINSRSAVKTVGLVRLIYNLNTD